MSASFHEPLRESGPPPGPSDRGFGLTVGGILVAIGLFRAVRTEAVGPVAGAMLIVGAALVVFALIWPGALHHLNRAWMALGMLLARIMNPVILFVLYVVAFVPIGLLMRLKRQDPLRRQRFEPGRSYWVEREAPADPAAGMVNQY